MPTDKQIIDLPLKSYSSSLRMLVQDEAGGEGSNGGLPVDSVLGYTPVNKSGDTMTGNLSFINATVTGLINPTSDSDAATKAYVDSLAAGMVWKTPAKVATTANIALAGLQIIDGYQTQSGDRVVAKNQTIASQNGIWIALVGSWVRATDADTGDKLYRATVNVTEGATQANSVWLQTTNLPITPGSTDLEFINIFSVSGYTAGAGISLVGNQISNTGVLSFNGRAGLVSLLQADVTTALGYTPFNKSGDTMLGVINMGGYKITNGATPTADSDLATKGYVDSSPSGTVTSVGISSSTLDIGTPNPITGSGVIPIDLDAITSPASNIFTRVSIDQYGRVTDNSPVTSLDIQIALGYTPLDKDSDLSDVSDRIASVGNLGLPTGVNEYLNQTSAVQLTNPIASLVKVSFSTTNISLRFTTLPRVDQFNSPQVGQIVSIRNVTTDATKTFTVSTAVQGTFLATLGAGDQIDLRLIDNSNEGGTWEDANISSDRLLGTIAATQVAYGDGANSIKGSTSFTYEEAQNRLKVGNAVQYDKFVTGWTGSPYNSYQFYGIGVIPGAATYSVAENTDSHIFYAGDTSSTRHEIARIKSFSGGGSIGVNGANPDVADQVKFTNSSTWRKAVFFQSNPNDHEVMSIGVAAFTFGFQSPNTSNDFLYRHGLSSSSSQESFRVSSNKIVAGPSGVSTIYGDRPRGMVSYSSGTGAGTATSIGTSDTPIGVSTTASNLNQFSSPASGQLQCNAPYPQNYEITLQPTFALPNAQQFIFTIYKNGSAITTFTQRGEVVNAGQINPPAPLKLLSSLSNGDLLYGTMVLLTNSQNATWHRYELSAVAV